MGGDPRLEACRTAQENWRFGLLDVSFGSGKQFMTWEERGR